MTVRYFIHGWLSSPEGEKATILKEHLDVHPIQYHTVQPEEIIIKDCLNEITKTLSDDTHITLIGSSLGGFLSAKIALDNPNVQKIILLNPAILPLNYDPSTQDSMPQRILEEMKDDRLHHEKISAKIIIINGNNDTVVPPETVVTFAREQEAEIHFLNDDHRLSKNMHRLTKLIEHLL